MDNLSVHRSNQLTERLDQLGIPYLFNVAYAPDFNGIEFVFARLKNTFKKLMTNAIVNKKKLDLEALIFQSIRQLEVSDIVNSINHSKRLLMDK